MTQTIYHPTTVSFHGQDIPIIEKDGIPYVAMRPIVEGIGLDWDNEQRRISTDPILNSTKVILTLVAKD